MNTEHNIIAVIDMESDAVQKLAFSLGFEWGATRDKVVRHYGPTRCVQFRLVDKLVWSTDLRDSDQTSLSTSLN